VLHFQMSSRWGLQIEGSGADLLKVRRYVNGSIRNEESHCVRMYGDIPILGTTLWDGYQNAEEVYRAAVVELAMIRTMVDLLEGCSGLEGGTVYEFQSSTNVRMWRKSNVNVLIPGTEKPAEDFAVMLARLRLRPEIEAILEIMVAEPTWPEIYRAYEALKDAFGKEKGLKRLFPSEVARIEKLRRTANEHRHFDVVNKIPHPMPYMEAVSYLKNLVRRAIASIDLPPYVGPGEFQVTLNEFDMPDNGATHLNNLSLADPTRNKIPVDLQ
jgi:hypothetical protein